ncbi:MARVEL domain-containing protein 3 isoform X2 [Pyxicephalus adspersus]
MSTPGTSPDTALRTDQSARSTQSPANPVPEISLNARRALSTAPGKPLCALPQKVVYRGRAQVGVSPTGSALRCIEESGARHQVGPIMVDSRPYPSDGEGRPPRKHRHEQRSGHPGTHDRNSELHDGYDNRSQNRPRDRHHEERGAHRSREDPGRAQYSERHREDRGQSRQHRDRGRDGHRDYEDRGHSRHRDEYQSERSHSHDQARGDHHKERSRNRYDERERQQEHERYVQSADHRGYPAEGKIPEHYNPSDRSYPPNEAQMQDIDYYEESGGGILDCHKCRYLCTGRGILQMLEVILNALVLICIISSYFVLSGFSAGMASGGFGGGYYPFEGQELQQVRQLDQEFSLLRSPLLYGGLTVSLLMGTLTFAILAKGSKHLLQLSDRWLMIETTFSLLASLGYVAAVGVFLHFALQINGTDVCRRREILYARNGLTWMNCELAGTDGGAAAFAIILVILYATSAVLAIRAYREKKAILQ